MEIREYTKKLKNTMDPERRDELIKKIRKEHDKMCKGKFEFCDANGGWFEFTYRYFNEPIKYIKLVHGEIVDLPMGIVKHINNTVRKVRNLAGIDDKGKARFTIERTSRIRFIPVDAL
jgi:hypothetical protein